jgi:hypothetical protein
MIAGSPAIDIDYERQCDPGQWVQMFWWPDRVWRWVRVSRLQWGRADAPADPDAALQPDRTLFRRGARQMVNVYGLEGQDAAATEMHPAIAHLRDSGEWLTAGDLAAWAGIKPGSMAGIIQRYRSQLDAWPQQIYKGGRSYRITYYRFKGG